MIPRLYRKYVQFLNSLRDYPLLAVRLVLAYGFFEPAYNKITHFNDIVEWFGTLQFHFPFTDAAIPMPLPALNAIMAVSTETSGIVLVTLGLATRLICVPMMFVMLVAISTVHLVNGYSCAHNGFEVPFYYFWFLALLLVTGPGKISLDHLIAKKMNFSAE